jgi:hypothetical protein
MCAEAAIIGPCLISKEGTKHGRQRRARGDRDRERV